MQTELDMMSFVAAPGQQKLRPAFTVKKLNGKVPHKQHIFDKKENKIKSRVIEVDAGYMVTFMKGHSIRCRDIEHVRKVGAGLDFIPILTEEGEVKGHVPNKIAE